jgi:hypothetical protein
VTEHVGPDNTAVRWRERWMADGCPWWSRSGPPAVWSPPRQLARVEIHGEQRIAEISDPEAHNSSDIQ